MSLDDSDFETTTSFVTGLTDNNSRVVGDCNLKLSNAYMACRPKKNI